MGKKTITLNNKKYAMPKMDIDTYMNYLELRDDIMNTENKAGLYTKQQFSKIMECICEVYGNQFTIEELKNKESGLSVSDIIMEFASIETGISGEVEKRIENLQKNFSNGK